MTDNLFSSSAATPPGDNTPEYSVSELSSALKRVVEDRFGHVRLRGEISGLKHAASGHMYLALKDDQALIDGVMWKGNVSRLNFRPEDGLEVVCTGKLTTYPGRSKYQIVIEQMAPAGVGALMALLEERKKKLAAEGLFASDRKRPIPYLPTVIGVVTSPTGAVIRDILHRLEERFPRHVLVWPVLVQGDGAAAQIANAIDGFNNMPAGGATPRPDVLIVARGGGSLEDLWAFNEEIVVRAAANSRIPLISAVGHETDTTLIDYAADLRAPTPTAAAEKAVPVRADLQFTLQDLHSRLGRSWARQSDEKRQRLQGAVRGLPRLMELLGLPQQRFDDLSERLPRSLSVGLQVQEGRLQQTSLRFGPRLLSGRLAQYQQDVRGLAARTSSGLRSVVRHDTNRLSALSARLQPQQMQRQQQRLQDQLTRLDIQMQRAAPRRIDAATNALSGPARLLESLSYKNVLQRGYAVVYGADGKAVTRAAKLQSHDVVALEFADGRKGARISDADGVSGVPVPEDRPKKTKKNKEPKDQGSLF